MSNLSQSLPLARAKVESSTLFAAIFAFSLGSALVLIIGFAQPDLIHNTAHDLRHSLNFPCH